MAGKKITWQQSGAANFCCCLSGLLLLLVSKDHLWQPGDPLSMHNEEGCILIRPARSKGSSDSGKK